jgi:hypothetical protein
MAANKCGLVEAFYNMIETAVIHTTLTELYREATAVCYGFSLFYHKRLPTLCFSFHGKDSQAEEELATHA